MWVCFSAISTIRMMRNRTSSDRRSSFSRPGGIQQKIHQFTRRRPETCRPRWRIWRIWKTSWRFWTTFFSRKILKSSSSSLFPRFVFLFLSFSPPLIFCTSVSSTWFIIPFRSLPFFCSTSYFCDCPLPDGYPSRSFTNILPAYFFLHYFLNFLFVCLMLVFVILSHSFFIFIFCFSSFIFVYFPCFLVRRFRSRKNVVSI